MLKKGLAMIPVLMSVTLLASPVAALAAVSGSSGVMVPIFTTAGGATATSGTTVLGGSGSDQQSQPNISLDKAISTFKQAFTIPAQLTDFSSGYSSGYMNRKVWDLHWMDPQNPPSGLDAQVDASTGEILNMRMDQSVKTQGPELGIPTLTEQDAQKIATDLVTRLDSDKMPELQLQKGSNSILNLNSYGPTLYSFTWQRMINKIPFTGEGVTVQVNGKNGQVMYYGQNWTKVSAQLPDAQKAISLDKAQGIFKDDTMLQLQYFQPPVYLPYGQTNNNVQVKLVYAPNTKYVNGAIDALTGEPVKPSEGWFNASQGSMGGLPIYSGGMGPIYNKGLSPQEQQDVDKNAKLISQDAAVKTVTQWVYIPTGAVLQNASLNSGWMEPNQKVWNLNWGPAPDKMKQGQMFFFINATVNAVTGELLNFNSPQPPEENGQKAQITREQALQIAEGFLQKIQPQRYTQVKLTDEDNSVVKPYAQNGMESFSFYRTANGIPFMNNGINVTVDTISKRILNYNLNWSDIELPAPKGILSADQADAAYLKACPLSLSYVQMYSGNNQGEVKLVYSPTSPAGMQWGSSILDAASGELVGWDGQPVSALPQPYQFKDISGNFAEKDITLLGQAGIFGEYGNQFKPDEKLTTIAMLRAMLTAQNGAWSTYSLSDQDILKTAQKLGWVSQDAQPNDPVDRVMLAQLMIHFLKLDNVARLKDAFQDPYSDVTSFPTGTEGYITLGKALGLFHFDGDQFKPEQPVARAEAAYALVQALTFAGQGTN